MLGEERLLTGPGGRHHPRFHLARLGLARPRDQAVRHRGPAQARPGRGQARKALRRRCAARRALRRGGGHAARRHDPVREAGPVDRRPGRARRAAPSSSASTNGTSWPTSRACSKDLKEKATRLLPQVRGAPVVPLSGLAGSGIDPLMKAVLAGLRDLEPPHLDRQAQPMARRGAGDQPAARGVRPPDQDPLHDADQSAPAAFRGVRQPARRPAEDATRATWSTASANPSTFPACRSASRCAWATTRSTRGGSRLRDPLSSPAARRAGKGIHDRAQRYGFPSPPLRSGRE